MDKARFDRIYRDTAVQLRRYVGNMTGWSPMLDDIMQDTYLRLITKAPEHLTDSKLKSYLFTITTNIVRDLWRRGALKRRHESLLGDYSTAVQCTDSVADRIDLRRVMESLKPMQKSLLWLAYAEGRTHEEIAAITGVKKKSVKVLLFRARREFMRLCDVRGFTLKEMSK